MKLRKVRIRGFQSFADTGEVEFDNEINLIVGQNNSGKSAILRSLLPNLVDDRHRTSDRWNVNELRQPETTFTIEVSGAEIRQWVLSSGSAQAFPVSPEQYQNCQRAISGLFNGPNIEVIVTRSPDHTFSSQYPSHQLFRPTSPQQRWYAIVTPSNGNLEIRPHSGASIDSLPTLLYQAWKENIYFLTAERMAIGQAPIDNVERLTPNANNLPSVLHTLSTERGSVFKKLVSHMREIFSTVGNIIIRVPRNSKGTFEVLIWPTQSMDQVDLSFALNNSGTGIAQALALLTAIMTSNGSIILIDEINSFLHPAAVKTLLKIIKTEYNYHQYIITTHAPDVISFSNPRTIHLVKRTGYESSIQNLDIASVESFRMVVENLGVSMADVFAAEQIIWVEGQTEELCFPYLYREMHGTLPAGTIFSSVIATGDFVSKRRDRNLIYEIYTRLSSITGTINVTVRFSFDSEKLSGEEKQGMVAESRGTVHFLPRRHLECYLIDVDAIVALIRERGSGADKSVTPEQVRGTLLAAASSQKFYSTAWNQDLSNENWLAEVDAAKLIDQVCASLSESRVQFKKKDDSLFLLQHILAHNKESLASLGDYVKSLVN
jgi:predicted ATPase